jgi:hypothetical protein
MAMQRMRVPGGVLHALTLDSLRTVNARADAGKSEYVALRETHEWWLDRLEETPPLPCLICHTPLESITHPTGQPVELFVAFLPRGGRAFSAGVCKECYATADTDPQGFAASLALGMFSPFGQPQQ